MWSSHSHAIQSVHISQQQTLINFKWSKTTTNTQIDAKHSKRGRTTIYQDLHEPLTCAHGRTWYAWATQSHSLRMCEYPCWLTVLQCEMDTQKYYQIIRFTGQRRYAIFITFHVAARFILFSANIHSNRIQNPKNASFSNFFSSKPKPNK